MADPGAIDREPGARTVVQVLGTAALVLLSLGLLAMLGLAALNTDPGRAFIAQQLERLVAPESGLRIRIGRLEGSLYGRLLIHDLQMADPKGVFATSPLVVLDWQPTALIQNRLLVDELSAGTVRMLRPPSFNETATEGPMLPAIDLTVRRLAIGRLVLEPPVTGQRHVVALSGDVDIADRRAVVTAKAKSSAGDLLDLELDAVPDAGRFDIDAVLVAPAGGVVAGLAGIDQALTASIAGKGSWSAWQGTARARLGGASLAELRLEGRDGLFTLTGTARPGLLLSGGPARLLSPTLNMRGTATLVERRIDVALRATSAALDLTVRGRVDLADSRFGNLTIAARLLRPALLLDATHGRDVRLRLTLDGPFGTPAVGYRLSAAQLTFAGTGVEGLHAEGRARLDNLGPAIIPVAATAARVVGVDAAVGGVLTNLRLNGTLWLTSQQLVSDDLRLRSDRLDATAVLAVSFATGRYDLALKGTVNRYELAGLGQLDLRTDARIVTAPSGEPGVRGTVQARVRRLDSSALRDLLGDLPAISAAVERQGDGTVRFTDVRIASSKLRIDDGRGVYRPDGTITLEARGRSTDYGPFTLQAAGPASRPRIRLQAVSPDVGLQLTNVEAVLTPTAEGYAIKARSGSLVGPVTAQARLGLGPGPLVLNIDALRLAGLHLQGRLERTATGPFAGALRVTGPGLSGAIRLAAAGDVQRIVARLEANRARIALEEPMLIAQGEAQVTALLRPAAPVIEGKVSIRGLRWGELALTRGHGQGTYRAGRGSAQVTVAGRVGAPFTLVADAGFTADRIRLGASGSVGRLEVRLAAPAELVAVRDGWRLQPASVLLGAGRIDVSGTLARDMRLSARLTDVDLGIVRAVSPELRLGGRVDGDVAVVRPARGAPAARLHLTVLDLTRASLAGTSSPVDIGVNAALSAGGGGVRAVLRRGTVVVGRLQARLAPLPGSPADPVTERLLGAPFAGGFRYDGPAEALWALSGVTGHEVRGPLAIRADFGGRISDPRLTGTARAEGLRYANLAFGTVVRDIELESRFAGPRFDLLSLTGRTGDEGRVVAQGTAILSAERGFPVNIQARFDDARLARRGGLSGTATGPVRFTHGPDGARLAGDLSIDSARYNIARESGAVDIPTIAVRRVPRPGAVPVRPARDTPAPASAIRLDLDVRADNNVRVEGMGLESEWQLRLEIGGTTAAPRVTGPVELVRGTVAFAGNRFELTRGVVRFTGATPPDPTLDIAAEAEVDGLAITLLITGSADRPQIAFSSTPALPEEEILARLLFGESVTELSAIQAVQLASSVAALQGGSGGLNPLGRLRRATGFDRLRILGADSGEDRSTALAVGEYLGDDIYVELTTDVRGYTATLIEIALTRALSVIAQVGGSGATNLGIQYSKDY